MKLENILVVEDKEENLRLAEESLVKDRGLNVTYAKTLDEAEALMAANDYDGIICDIFFPSGKDYEQDRALREKLAQAMHRAGYISEVTADLWEVKEDLIPMGVYIAEAAKEQRIPFVFCTDTYHHGKETAPIFEYVKKEKIAMVDVMKDFETGELDKKDYGRAFNAFIEGGALYGCSSIRHLKKLGPIENGTKSIFKEE